MIIAFNMKHETKQNNCSVGRLFSMINHYAHVYFKHNFREFPIGHAQIFTLHHLIKHDGITQKQLTQYSKLDKGSIASQLQYLEKNGYILRKPSKDDARVLNIFITEKTEILKDDLNKIFSGWSEILLDGFEENDQNEVRNILLKILASAENNIRDLKK